MTHVSILLQAGIAVWMTYLSADILSELRWRRRRGYPLTKGPWLFLLGIAFAALNLTEVIVWWL